MRIGIPAILVLLVAPVAACGPPRSPADTDGQASGTSSTSVGTGTPTTGTATSMGSTDASGPGTGTGAADTGDDSHAFVFEPDLGFPDCALGAGGCPDGFKCNPIDNDTPQCVPVVPDPKAPGEPCSVLGDASDGTDDCQANVVCMFPDEQGIGKCHAICEVETAGGEDLVCPPELECIRPLCQSCFWGWCDVPCDPRELDACKPGQLCVEFGDDWWCVIDASGEEGQAGDPCEFINVCDPGLTCMDASLLPGCVNPSGCCSTFCSTDQPNTCPNAGLGEVCVPWYGEAEALPQFTTLGVCAVPQ